MKRRVRSGRRGFTLPEVILSMMVATLTISVFGTTFPACSYTIARSRGLDMASDGCQRQLDVYRDAGYASLPQIPDGQQSVSQAFSPVVGLPNAAGSVTFTHVSDAFAASAAPTGIIRAEVTVSWTGRGTNKGSVTLSSLIAR